jgi:hypothetical protein
LVQPAAWQYILGVDEETPSMKNTSKTAMISTGRIRELRSELARKIVSFMGSAEKKATDIPGMTLHRRTAPTPPCRTTYHPGVT